MNLGGKAAHLLFRGSFDLDGVGQLSGPVFQVVAERAGRLASPLLDGREINEIAAEISIFHEAEKYGLPLALGQRADSGKKTFG